MPLAPFTGTFGNPELLHLDVADGAFGADISPNPSADGQVRLTLRGQTMEEAMTEITISDLYGRPISQQLEQIIADTPVWLNLGGNIPAPSGIYFVTVRQGSQQVVRRVVVR